MIWSKYQQNIKITQPVLKGEFVKVKNKKPIILIATETHIIKLKNGEAKKMIPLDFDTKFEIVRQAPIMKGVNSPMKLSTTSRADQIKSENIQSLGEVISISLMKDEGKLELIANQKTMSEWRWYLGTKINQFGFHHLFKVYKKIGKGNFASVYLAERVEDGQQMAIKAFSKSVAYAEENGKEGLINEIQLMRQFDHPNIIKLYEVHETSNSLYICLELLEGGQLYECFKKKVIFQNKEIIVLIKGLLEALKHCHSKNIMHRDIKLENILFRKQNQIDSVILADFGLATNMFEKKYLYCRCGTPGFVAPEVINIKDLTTKYDKICDVYSLGVVFHLLLTGKPVFAGRSYTTIVNQNKEAKINWNSPVYDLIPRSAFDLLKKMLEPDPTKRISAQDALEHKYFNPQIVQSPCQFDEDLAMYEDSCQLDQRLQKINELNNTFDMMRINQLTNSPIKSPNIRATQTKEMKEGQANISQEEQIIMHTPVITGRLEGIAEDSPGQKKIQEIKKHQRQESLSYLQKYSKQQQQQQQQQQQIEEIGMVGEENDQVNHIKNSLSKNV